MVGIIRRVKWCLPVLDNMIKTKTHDPNWDIRIPLIATDLPYHIIAIDSDFIESMDPFYEERQRLKIALLPILDNLQNQEIWILKEICRQHRGIEDIPNGKETVKKVFELAMKKQIMQNPPLSLEAMDALADYLKEP